MKKEIIELMQRENLLQEEWNDMVRSKEEAMMMLEKERGEKENALMQKEEERKQKEEERKQKETILRISVLSLLEFGLSKDQIAEKLNISIFTIDELTHH
jgi:DNA-binding NarL/FixJ family response regulator